MKILYSVTVKIDVNLEEDWVAWMKTKHILDVMNTGMFESYKMYRLLGQDETDGINYSVQYVCQDMKTLHQYTIKYSPALQLEHKTRYENKFVSFRTLLEIIE